MKRIVFTREHPLEVEWLKTLEDKGYTVEHAPLIQCQAVAVPEKLFDGMDPKEWIIFTSKVAVDFFFQAAEKQNAKISCHMATIGPQTSETVKKWGYSVDFESKHHYAKEFVKEWTTRFPAPQKIYMPQSNLANAMMKQILIEQGYEVLAFVMYETVANRQGQGRILELMTDNIPTIWTFASGSAWESFYDVQKELPTTDKIAVIGTSTKDVVEKSPYPVNYMPSQPLISEMITHILNADINERKGSI